MRLEWDARKGRENLRKHGVSFEEASSVFLDRKSTRLNSSHSQISYGAFCLKKKNRKIINDRSSPTTKEPVGTMFNKTAEPPMRSSDTDSDRRLLGHYLKHTKKVM